MDSLFLFLLLLGGTPDPPSIDASPGPLRVQAVASARILRGEAIDFETPVNRLHAHAEQDGGTIFVSAPTRSTARLAGADGRTTQLQEFH